MPKPLPVAPILRVLVTSGTISPAKRALPPTVSAWLSVDVPTPTFPAELTTSAFEPTERSEAKRFVEEAVVEKNEVVVAAVPVALRKVKFWSVDDPVAKRFANESVPVAVMLAAVMLPLKRPLPCTESFWAGVVEPMPANPVDALTVRFADTELEALRRRSIPEVELKLPVSEVTPPADWMELKLPLEVVRLATEAAPPRVRVPVAVRFAAAMSPEKRPLPWTESFWAGLVEPMPTFPAK